MGITGTRGGHGSTVTMIAVSPWVRFSIRLITAYMVLIATSADMGLAFVNWGWKFFAGKSSISSQHPPWSTIGVNPSRLRFLVPILPILPMSFFRKALVSRKGEHRHLDLPLMKSTSTDGYGYEVHGYGWGMKKIIWTEWYSLCFNFRDN